MPSKRMDNKTVIRQLSTEDFLAVSEIYKAQVKHMGLNVENYYEQQSEEKILQYLNPKIKNRVLFGVFIENQLVLCMGIFFWKHMPYGTFLRFASRKGYFEGKAIQKAFRQLYKACLDELEKREYYRFYLISSAKHQDVLAYMGATWEEFRTRYIITVEEVIPAGTKPKFEYTWSIMGERVWAVDLTLRAGTLLNKYRKFDRNIIGEKAMMLWDQTGVSASTDSPEGD